MGEPNRDLRASGGFGNGARVGTAAGLKQPGTQLHGCYDSARRDCLTQPKLLSIDVRRVSTRRQHGPARGEQGIPDLQSATVAATEYHAPPCGRHPALHLLVGGEQRTEHTRALLARELVRAQERAGHGAAGYAVFNIGGCGVSRFRFWDLQCIKLGACHPVGPLFYAVGDVAYEAHAHAAMQGFRWQADPKVLPVMPM